MTPVTRTGTPLRIVGPNRQPRAASSAVAISIGFGATLARMKWVQAGRLPEPDEFNQTLALLTALLATALSWDGHLLSMRSTPLFDFWRFLINIALAFIYMFLLMASVHPGCVLRTLAIIFLLHVVWDVLTIREDVASYDHTLAGVSEPSAAQIWRVYVGGFVSKAQIQAGPVITLAWTIYFVLLAIIANGRADAHVRTACFFALVGLVGYRLDEARQRGSRGEESFAGRWPDCNGLGAACGFQCR